MSTEIIDQLVELVRFSDLRNFETDHDIAEVIMLHREEFLTALRAEQ